MYVYYGKTEINNRTFGRAGFDLPCNSVRAMMCVFFQNISCLFSFCFRIIKFYVFRFFERTCIVL